MDDALVARWRGGDPTATTAVRNGIRTVAERMLSHTNLRGVSSAKARRVAEDEGQRREVTADIAREVMVRGGATAADVTAITIMVTARKAVELLRFDRPVTGETHLPPQVAVSYALAPDSLPKPSQEAAGKHVEECPLCSEDVGVIRAVVRSNPAESTPVPVAPPRPAPQPTGPSSQDVLAELERPRPKPSPKPDKRPKERDEPRPEKKGSGPRQAGYTNDQPASQAMFPVLIVAFLAILVGWSQVRASQKERYSKRMAVATLVPRAAPVIDDPDIEVLAEFDAIDEALYRDSCQVASRLLKDAYLSHPQIQALARIQAQALVCYGDGTAALAALKNAPPDGETNWVRAQALLLAGDVEGGMEALRETMNTNRIQRSEAKRLLKAVEVAWD